MLTLTWNDIGLSHHASWNAHVDAANRCGQMIVKLRMMDADADVDRACRRLKWRYLEAVCLLVQAAPRYIVRIRQAALDKAKFLERKLDLMQRAWKSEMYDQFRSDLIRYELLMDQAEILDWPLT